jgi:hypothetical protein
MTQNLSVTLGDGGGRQTITVRAERRGSIWTAPELVRLFNDVATYVREEPPHPIEIPIDMVIGPEDRLHRAAVLLIGRHDRFAEFLLGPESVETATLQEAKASFAEEEARI